MRLLRPNDDGEFSLVEFFGNNIPKYAILSHTWGEDEEEVSFKDIVKGRGKSRAGYAKIQFCREQAAKDGLQYFWVDTCCINKSSSAELSEAINSMFQWYQRAEKCYTFLADVTVSAGSLGGRNPYFQLAWKPAFQKSRWFTRGWTLQELVAPRSVEFFSMEGIRLGDKTSLLQEIHDITRISIQALRGSPLSQVSFDERMSWAEGRDTKREEDAAYSLLGIFDIHIPLIYGEGRRKAFSRLQKEFKESLNSQTPVSPTLPISQFQQHSNPSFDQMEEIERWEAENSFSLSLEASPEEKIEEEMLKEDFMQQTKHHNQEDFGIAAGAVKAPSRKISEDSNTVPLEDTLQRLREEIGRLAELNDKLSEENRNLTNRENARYAQLQEEMAQAQEQLQQAERVSEELQTQNAQMESAIEEAVRSEIISALEERDTEIERLYAENTSAKEKIETLEKQILLYDSFLTVLDDDFISSACLQFYRRVQQSVLHFSNISATRPCRPSRAIAHDPTLDITTRRHVRTLLGNAILDGSNVDVILANHVSRRYVFVSMIMEIIWKCIFTPYFFGIAQEQEEQLRLLEKSLSGVGPARAVAQWRASTLTLLSKQSHFIEKRAWKTKAVTQQIYNALSALLPPSTHFQRHVYDSFSSITNFAVTLSIEMRTQRANYHVVQSPQPEYSIHGYIDARIPFNASLMDEVSGHSSNEELEARKETVQIELFPLVVKRGNDMGDGEDESVVFPAQVFVSGS